MQKEFLRTLNAEKKIGLCLNSSLLLTPLKSVTAAIGLENKDAPRIIKKKDCTAWQSFCLLRIQERWNYLWTLNNIYNQANA